MRRERSRAGAGGSCAGAPARARRRTGARRARAARGRDRVERRDGPGAEAVRHDVDRAPDRAPAARPRRRASPGRSRSRDAPGARRLRSARGPRAGLRAAAAPARAGTSGRGARARGGNGRRAGRSWRRRARDRRARASPRPARALPRRAPTQLRCRLRTRNGSTATARRTGSRATRELAVDEGRQPDVGVEREQCVGQLDRIGLAAAGLAGDEEEEVEADVQRAMAHASDDRGAACLASQGTGEVLWVA